MKDLLTDEQIAELEKMLELSSPAPWEQHYGFNNGGMATAFFHIPSHNQGAQVEMLADDAALIVEMRNALPLLIAEVKARRAKD